MDGRPYHLERRRRRRPTEATAAVATDVVHRRPSSVGVPVYHTQTHTRRHERCPWCRRRRVSSSSNDGGGTGQERYTGNTIHRGGYRVVAHHRAYQYGTRYIGRTHARTNTHAHTLSRSATAARGRSRTRTHRWSGARATPTFTRTRERAGPRALHYPTAHVCHPTTTTAATTSYRVLYNVADGDRPIVGRHGIGWAARPRFGDGKISGVGNVWL